MSSLYRLICLSHDPAIEIDPEHEWHSGSGGREKAEEAAKDGIDWHPGCDLLIGKYSYPLVEIGCPSSSHKSRFLHRDTQWIDACWAALIIIADESGLQLPYPFTNGCWKPDRLRRLKVHLSHYLEREVVKEPAVKNDSLNKAANLLKRAYSWSFGGTPVDLAWAEQTEEFLNSHKDYLGGE